MEGTESISHTGFHAGSFSVNHETRAAAEAARRQVCIMSATLHPFPSHHEPVAAPAARLALKADGTSRGLLDGAWWPRSRDLLSELPSLTDALDPLWGRITRVAVNPTHWPIIPRKVPVHGRVVKVGWFTTEIDPHKLLLLSYGTGRWDLLVIPPETGAEAAARLMAAASDYDGPPLTASALVAADEALHGVSVTDESLDSSDRDEAWEDEGGAAAVSAAVPRQTGPAGRVGPLIVGM
ncbi:hypothetical protein K4B79_35945 [Streptomyces lincolnensis]|uniref:DUF5994 family protein n=1 Tax=Streptomyces lincolnensis TaxID=1915 RepID=UPI001E4B97A8|nr:DUF5994 family protein [Streptomyces lincolnensis]MCD7443591.1 hypothetical protein [Streptomyces lincolnensis]